MAESPVDGDHAYVLAPLAVRVVEVPAQIVIVPLTETVGSGLTVTINVAVPVHPTPLVPVTV